MKSPSVVESGQGIVRACWCGNDELEKFSDAYQICPKCETLVSMYDHGTDVSRVRGDDTGLYGREYWFSHQANDLGFPNIYQRARVDLSERCLHWLEAVLKYKVPPARVLELGSAHGGFVSMLRWAGFDATGLELSPSIVSIARELFDVPILRGRIEDQNPEGLFDVIVLLDVLEHLPAPVETLRRCLLLLKPQGFFLIQTPMYPEGKRFPDLIVEGHRFVEMLKDEEHLYLFSAKSIVQLFAELGCAHMSFEPALFSHYDMFLAVSREPLKAIAPSLQDEALARTPGGRLVLAARDLFTRLRDSATLTGRLQADVGALQAEIGALRSALSMSEADRTARLEVIQRQGDELGRIESLEADIEYLKEKIRASQADVEYLEEKIRAGQGPMPRVKRMFRCLLTRC